VPFRSTRKVLVGVKGDVAGRELADGRARRHVAGVVDLDGAVDGAVAGEGGAVVDRDGAGERQAAGLSTSRVPALTVVAPR